MTVASALLEICVDTPAGLRVAVAGGAGRVELCAALTVGGLTPSTGLMHLARSITHDTRCSVRAMIRPRAGDFTYTGDEIDVMLSDMDAVARAGLDGVVFGANLPSGGLDLPTLSVLMQKARNLCLEAALHRSFDLAPDPKTALDSAIDLGFATVLTSGCAPTASQGLEVLRSLARQALRPDGTPAIEILAGSGVTTANLDAILACGIRAIHASCSAPAGIICPRAADLGYLPADLRQTDSGLVAQMRAALDAHTPVPLQGAAHVVC